MLKTVVLFNTLVKLNYIFFQGSLMNRKYKTCIMLIYYYYYFFQFNAYLINKNNMWPWNTKPVKSLEYICSNSKKYIVWVKIIKFLFYAKNL